MKDKKAKPSVLKKVACAAGALALVAVVGVIVYATLSSGIFRLASVEVEGNHHLSDEQVRQIMGVSEGDNLWSISLRGVMRRLESSPWIKSASVRKEYPRQIRVRIDEARPVALLQSRDAISLIDSDGQTLETYTTAVTSFLPVLVGDSRKDIPAFRDAVALAGVLKKQGLATEESRVEISGFENGSENIELMIEGLVVKMGKGGYEEKLNRFLSLRDEFQKLAIDKEYVDLRFANRVIVKQVMETVQ